MCVTCSILCKFNNVVFSVSMLFATSSAPLACELMVRSYLECAVGQVGAIWQVCVVRCRL